jgi:hypothetical protein
VTCPHCGLTFNPLKSENLTDTPAATPTTSQDGDGFQGRRDVPGRLERVLEAVAAILYDQEWTGRPYRATSNAVPVHSPYYPDIQLAYACDYVFEHMLLIDYGFPAAPIRPPMLIPPRHYFLETNVGHLEDFSRFLTATAYM